MAECLRRCIGEMHCPIYLYFTCDAFAEGHLKSMNITGGNPVGRRASSDPELVL